MSNRLGIAVIMIMLITVTITGTIYYNNTTNEDTFTTKNIEIIEITYLQKTFGSVAKTILRCHSETIVLSGIEDLPYGNVTITIRESKYTKDIYYLEEWRR